MGYKQLQIWNLCNSEFHVPAIFKRSWSLISFHFLITEKGKRKIQNNYKDTILIHTTII